MWEVQLPRETVTFEYIRCDLVRETEVAGLMYERSSAGGSIEGSKRECAVCGVWVCTGNFVRHIITCVVSKSWATECQRDGRTLPYFNISRYQRTCRVSDSESL